MKIIRVCISVITALVVTAAVLTGCGGGGSGNGGGGTLTVSGIVSDNTGTTVAGATVTLRNASNAALSTATTATNGSYTLSNVPASTDVYIDVSKATYANFNTEILNLTANTSRNLFFVTSTVAKSSADAFSGAVGGTSWSDPFYAGKSWFALDIDDASYFSVPGITVTATPGVTRLAYNNGSDVYSTTPPTVSAFGYPLIGGYNSSAEVSTFTMTTSTKTRTVKLPLVPGEITYVVIQPW